MMSLLISSLANTSWYDFHRRSSTVLLRAAKLAVLRSQNYLFSAPALPFFLIWLRLQLQLQSYITTLNCSITVVAYWSITVIPYQWRYKWVFLHPSNLQTDCSKYLLKRKFGSGSRSQKISVPPAPAPQHCTWV